MKKIILSIAVLTTITMADSFESKKADCINVLKTTITCMEKSKIHAEMKACKMKMKEDMMKIRGKMFENGKMKYMSNSKCAAGKCGGAK